MTGAKLNFGCYLNQFKSYWNFSETRHILNIKNRYLNKFPKIINNYIFF